MGLKVGLFKIYVLSIVCHVSIYLSLFNIFYTFFRHGGSNASYAVPHEGIWLWCSSDTADCPEDPLFQCGPGGPHPWQTHSGDMARAFYAKTQMNDLEVPEVEAFIFVILYTKQTIWMNTFLTHTHTRRWKRERERDRRDTYYLKLFECLQDLLWQQDFKNWPPVAMLVTRLTQCGGVLNAD